MLGSLGAFGTLGLISGVTITGAGLSVLLDSLDRKTASIVVSNATKFIVYGIVFYMLTDLCVSIIKDYYLTSFVKGWWR